MEDELNPKSYWKFLLLLIPILVSASISSLGIIGGALIFIGVMIPIMVYSITRFPKFGVVFFLIAAYFIMFIINMGINFPLGTLMDAMLLLLFLGFFIKQKTNPNWGIFKNPISLIILVWIGFNLLEVFNPAAASKMAWLYTIRSVALVMLSYFIFSYHINTTKFLKLIIKMWLCLSIIAALYAMKQEYIGFSSFEEAALSNPIVRDLLFIDGHWRKSSIFSDPVAFSYNMVASSLLCIALTFGIKNRSKKMILIALALLFMYVMLFSGTRASYILIPAAMILLTILKLNWKLLIFSTFGGLVFLILIFIPTGNYNLYRFQSAFKPSDDASYNVRSRNQKRIQPFIQSHPMGGGLGATGVWGTKFAPDSYLAKFPPDSGYVRVAVELGWIGLFLICTFFFVILKTGINNYFSIKDPELKSYCLAMVLIIFALSVGNFPQEAIVQFPLNIYFYLAVAIINITLRLDQQKLVKDYDNEKNIN